MTMRTQDTIAAAGLWFSIRIESDEFVALLAVDALERLCAQAETPAEPRSAYRRHRKVIDAVALKKFQDGYPRPIKVEAADFN